MVSGQDFAERRPYNAATDFVDFNIAAGRSGKTAFSDGRRSLSYGELLTQSQRFAHGLHALGLRQEGRIALQGRAGDLTRESISAAYFGV